MAYVLLAPDKFKGSLDARQVTQSMREAILRVTPGAKVVSVPMADGGEGTVQAVTDAIGGNLVSLEVTGPLGTPVTACYGISADGSTAVMEMASASGLPLVPPHMRNPLVTTTYGTGEMIRDALTRGCRKVVMGIGGSATNDGGAGMAQALGVSLLDADGRQIARGGRALSELRSVSLEGLMPEAREADFVVACDVDNPLFGPRGAAAVYGPQKGATPEMVKELDDGLKNFARVLVECTGRDVAATPGAGAAGGLGAGLMALLGATLRSGVDLMIEVTGLRQKMIGADLVITGEGKMDEQTLMGKVAHGVARAAKELSIPVFSVVGSYTAAGDPHEAGITAIFAASMGPDSLENAMKKAYGNVLFCTEQAYRAFIAGSGIRSRNGV